MDRYVLGEMAAPFISSVLLIVVMLVGNTLFPLTETIAKSSISFAVVAKLVVCNIPTLVVLTLPAATALSAAWAVNRLARDSEITAIRMAGVPLRRLFAPIYIVGVIASLTSFYVGDRVVPRAQHEFEQTQAQMLAYAFQASPEVAQNKVFTYEDYSFAIKYIHKDPSGDPNKLKLEGVTIFRSPFYSPYPEIITAETADYEHDIWTLHNLVVREIGADGYVTVEAPAKTMTLNLHVPLTGLAESAFVRPDELSMEQLGVQMRALAKTGQDNSEVAVNYYSKLALPFVCLAFALCAPPIALRSSKAGPYVGIFVAVLMVWVAWNTLFLTKLLGIAGKLNPFLAAWSPDILFFAVGIYYVLRGE